MNKKLLGKAILMGIGATVMAVALIFLFNWLLNLAFSIAATIGVPPLYVWGGFTIFVMLVISILTCYYIMKSETINDGT
jgi:hypothetical protein